jgi:exosortase/archaeosortase family protein
MQETVAMQSAWVLESMGFSAYQQGEFITVSEKVRVPEHGPGTGSREPFYFMINQDCTGWKSMLFLFALIFAVPGVMLGRRLWGLLFGLVVIWVGNIARVVGVVLAERAHGVQAAMLIHDYLWQAGLIALVLGLWLIWMAWVRRERRKHGLAWRLRRHARKLGRLLGID